MDSTQISLFQQKGSILQPVTHRYQSVDDYWQPGKQSLVIFFLRYSTAFPLIDIIVVPDNKIIQHCRVALLELIQKHIRKRDLVGLVEKLAVLPVKGRANDNQLKASFNYLMQAGNTTHFGEFLHEVAERLPQYKDKLMTIAERL